MKEQNEEMKKMREWAEEVLKDKPLSDRGFVHSLL